MGKNELSYKIRDGTDDQTLGCSIYLTNEDTKLIVFDIDGTLTKDDFHSYINTFGIYAFQKNVGELCCKQKEMGYFLVFLTARLKFMVEGTRHLLDQAQRFGEYLPDAPVMTNPENLDHWAKREIINANPDEMKTTQMNSIQSLFPSKDKTITAGFGNSSTDAAAYIAIGIDKSRIFITNPEGEIYNFSDDKLWTYKKILDNINTIFPKTS